jgi:hypothetical protein
MPRTRPVYPPNCARRSSSWPELDGTPPALPGSLSRRRAPSATGLLRPIATRVYAATA